MTGTTGEDLATDYELIGWLDPDASHANRLHLRGCACSKPLRALVHREANHVFVRGDIGRDQS